MSNPELRYTLEKAGWATATWDDGAAVEITVSYLHDSLKDLAESVILLESREPASVLFMDEPGEHMLLLERSGEEVSYQLRWFQDWASWNFVPQTEFRVVAEGTMSFDHYRRQVSAVLRNILALHGLAKYKELWIEHEFPMEQYSIVCGAA